MPYSNKHRAALAIDQPALDFPELLWKAYIDFEISKGEFERTRAQYERFLNRTKHLNMENTFGELPNNLKKRSKIYMEDGPAVHEEYIDYLFPEEMQANNL
ncbi:hypothetical protein RDI58_007993 [Solanum bulbocastanum]|uniref:Uncharacterized protein n=1 Tax=Solanum bulbocastanum TaxID=147425 RepID=A0AAN8TUT5_SOLBU